MVHTHKFAYSIKNGKLWSSRIHSPNGVSWFRIPVNSFNLWNGRLDNNFYIFAPWICNFRHTSSTDDRIRLNLTFGTSRREDFSDVKLSETEISPVLNLNCHMNILKKYKYLLFCLSIRETLMWINLLWEACILRSRLLLAYAGSFILQNTQMMDHKDFWTSGFLFCNFNILSVYLSWNQYKYALQFAISLFEELKTKKFFQ